MAAGAAAAAGSESRKFAPGTDDAADVVAAIDRADDGGGAGGATGGRTSGRGNAAAGPNRLASVADS